ncbi:hypothetical protein ABZZ74_40235 [Streptomyces sp. NPDC006476]|uniref:hypothetical protein n=1 Tax=Streptomyces sp. NPDC006476 TaxID=3157175 RepID=UPI0033B95565
MHAEELRQHGIDQASLPSAPGTEPTRQEFPTRLNTLPPAPCARCSEAGITTNVTDAGDGPRWLDLCWPHARELAHPYHRPTTIEEILDAILEVAKEVAAEMGLSVPLRIWTDEEG